MKKKVRALCTWRNQTFHSRLHRCILLTKAMGSHSFQIFCEIPTAREKTWQFKYTCIPASWLRNYTNVLGALDGCPLGHPHPYGSLLIECLPSSLPEKESDCLIGSFTARHTRSRAGKSPSCQEAHAFPPFFPLESRGNGILGVSTEKSYICISN